MLTLDAAMLLSAVPGIASMLLSEQRQRIGDYMADTVVLDTTTPHSNVVHRSLD